MSIGEHAERDEAAPDGSSFRIAIARARSRSAPVSVLGATETRRVFEVRAEKRRGKKDVARWNKLGLAGWELVSVVGEHAYFRREVPVDEMA